MICSIMIPVYCRYTALYVLFFDELSGPAGNRLKHWPDIENSGTVCPFIKHTVRTVSLFKMIAFY